MVVDIRLLKLLRELVARGLARSLNAEHIQDLVDMVAEMRVVSTLSWPSSSNRLAPSTSKTCCFLEM